MDNINPDGTEWILALNNGGMRFYEHIPTARPVCIGIGADPEIKDRVEVVGYRITYRLPGSPMNMQVDCPVDHQMVESIMKMIGSQYTSAGKLANPCSELELFLNTLYSSNKIRTGVIAEEPEEPEESKESKEAEEPKEAKEPESPGLCSNKRIKLSDAAEVEAEECRMCMDKPADTVALPCMCRIVCKKCSDDLQTTNDAKICFGCRNPITNVVHADSSIKLV